MHRHGTSPLEESDFARIRRSWLIRHGFWAIISVEVPEGEAASPGPATGSLEATVLSPAAGRFFNHVCGDETRPSALELDRASPGTHRARKTPPRLSHPVHLQHLIAEVIDHLHRDLLTLGHRKRAADGRVEA